MPMLEREEVLRKVLHIFSGPLIAAGVFYLPRFAEKTSWVPAAIPSWVYPAALLGATLAVLLGVEALRTRFPGFQRLFKKWFGSMLREDEAQGRKATGATYIVASALLCSILFRDQPWISFMVLLTFIWGDGVAAIVGQTVGRIKIGEKTLEGTLACFALCLFLFAFVFTAVPGLVEARGGALPLHLVIIMSLAISVLELMPLRLTPQFIVNDNLAVPVLAGLILYMM